MSKSPKLPTSVLEKIEKVNIADLTFLTDEENTVIHPDAEIKAIAKNLKKYGQYRPIVIDEKGKILAGNAVTKAHQLIDVPTVFAVRYEKLTEKEKDGLMLMDNYTSEMNFFRKAFARDLALTLDPNDYELGGLVTTDEEIREMFAMRLGVDPEDQSTNADAPPAPNKSEVVCPNCEMVIKL